MSSSARAQFNAEIVAEFRANGGHLGGDWAETPLILVHHVGARSGEERVVPLAYLPRPGGVFVVIASDGGAATHPSWYYNLKATPGITVEVGAETFRVVAKELDPIERATMWPMMIERFPAAGEFQRMTLRTIPVFALTCEDVTEAEETCGIY